MLRKHPIDSDHLRSKPPHGFGWIDHRLLREGYLAQASTPAMALYLVLVCASDQEGLSYYSAPRLAQLVGVAESSLRQARQELIDLRLVAYRKPLWQLLSLGSEGQARRKVGEVPPSRPLFSTALEEEKSIPFEISLKAAVEKLLSKGAL